MEHTTTETLDKYRVEINRGTTGGQMGFSVKATGSDKETVLVEAIDLAKAVDQSMLINFPPPVKKEK